VLLALAVAVGFGAGQLMTSGVGQATSTPSPSALPTVVSSPSPSPTAEPSGTPSPGPTNSPAAGSDDVLLAFTQACDVTPPVLLPTTVILEDGRLIWQENGPATYQWRTRQLSSAGLETIRARIAATGLLDHAGDYRPRLREGVTEGPPHGACAFTFDHQDGATDVSVTSTMWFGDEEEAAYWEPAPERHELDAFAQQLRSPEAWLGPDDWSDAASAPYVSNSYLVLVSEEFGQGNGPDLEAVDWPFDAPPSTYGESVDNGRQPPQRCGMASREAIERYVAGQTQPGGEPIDLAAPSTYLNVREGDIWYAVNLWSVPVPGVADCSDVI
jgi:hypothetical protein